MDGVPAPAPLKHLAICTPCYRDIHTETHLLVINFLTLSRPEGWGPTQLYTDKFQPVSWCREAITERALGMTEDQIPGTPLPDVLLWLDSDVGVDVQQDLWDLVLHLDQAPPEVWVLGAPICIRVPPVKDQASGLYVEADPVPNLSTYPEAKAHAFRGTTAWSLPTHPDDATPSRPFAAVQAIGMGCTAIRRRAFEALPQPWWDFKQVKDEEGKKKLYGEDFGFCDRVRLAGGFVVADFSVRGWHYIEQKKYTPTTWTFHKAPVSWR